MAADKLLKAFTTLVDEFKAKQVQTAKKSFSKATAKPNSSVAALLEKRHQEELLDALKPTAGNLLVVPSTLLNHWEASSVQRTSRLKFAHTLLTQFDRQYHSGAIEVARRLEIHH